MDPKKVGDFSSLKICKITKIPVKKWYVINQQKKWRWKYYSKGQSISKCPFGVFVYTKIPTKFFARIFAVASKKKSNQKSSARESK